MIGIGTIINTVTVLAGGSLGTLLGARLPEKMRETMMHSLGLLVLVIGFHLSLETSEILILLGSLLLGGFVGELLRIEDRLNGIGHWLEQRMTAPGKGATTGQAEDPARSNTTQFSRAFLTASLVFCVGPMTVVGCLQDGLTGDYKLLAVKSALDFFAALAFASTLGPGVISAALTVLAYQGGLTLGARWVSALLTDPMIAEMTASGGVLMLAIGFALLQVKRIRTGNLLPAIAVAPVIIAIVEWVRTAHPWATP